MYCSCLHQNRYKFTKLDKHTKNDENTHLFPD